MVYKPIVGTLGYILSKDRKQVLLIHRNKRDQDPHFGKYNGVGGKLEPNEDVLTCMKREIFEEVGINCLSTEFRGTIHWKGFGPNRESWLGFVFLITDFSGSPFTSNLEGDLEWIDLERMEDLPMWDGDRYFLPLVFDEKKAPFYAYLVYESGKASIWKCLRNPS